MAVFFSPITAEELAGPFDPLPRHAFIMAPLGLAVSRVEKEMLVLIRRGLAAHGFTAVDATEISGTSDFLHKIVQTIRGTGFGVVVFSENTSSATLANIFFEAAVCLLLGKQVIVAKTAKAKAPSDFVRTEWIEFTQNNNKEFTRRLDRALEKITGLTDFYFDIAEVAFDAPIRDYEMIAERLMQAILVGNSAPALAKLREIKRILTKDDKSETMSASRHKLSANISHFVKALTRRSAAK